MATQEEIRRRVTNEIVAALREGTMPWRRPWSELENSGLPTSVLTEEPYSGVNFWTLQLAASRRGFTSKWWGTFNAWQSHGLQVKKRPDDVPPGAWGTRCVYFRPVTKTTKKRNGEDEEERFFILKEFVLFNAEQVTGPGVESFLARPRTGGGFVDYQPAEDAIAATGADIRHGGNWAVYRSEQDYIQLPPKGAFSQPHEYYATALHELVHYTGHESRLARLTKLARFGSEAYAVEELCAEIGAAFLCADLGIPQSDDLSNTAAYLDSWLRVLGRDINAVFTASSAASAAASFILSFSRGTKEPSDDGQKEAAQEQATGAH